ncbi:MAG: peptidoglycan-binding domain-containing protein [Candidatus Omnitrophota bacterium]|nr:peptidoglycan-binding domain-containing protein [Candidatus Omnitrophota bacterium]
MFKKVFVFLFLVVFAAALAGCATSGAVKQKDMEVQGLKNQISVLESQIQSKDQEISGLQDALNKANEQPKVEPVTEVKEKAGSEVRPHHLSNKEVQLALRNAGFDPGKIDGHMGKQTRDALRAFQKAHNLTANGKANKKTQALLSGYLTQKTK